MAPVRAALAVALAVISIGCGKSERQAPIEGPVGLVAALEGQAQARRDQEPVRALEVGSIVFAKDTIIVADGASIDIEFEGVEAHWSLTGPADKHVSQASAWDAVVERHASMARAETEGNRGAGRVGDRTAGMSSNEVRTPKAKTPETSATATAQDTEGGATDPNVPNSGPVTPPDPDKVVPDLNVKRNDRDDKQPRRPPKIVRPLKIKPAPAETIKNEKGGKLSVRVLAETREKGAVEEAKKQDGEAPDHATLVRRAVQKHAAAISKCADSGKLMITVKVSSAGKVEVSASGKSATCVKAALAGMSVPSAAGASVRLSLSW
jgi:hypothetical protein